MPRTVRPGDDERVLEATSGWIKTFGIVVATELALLGLVVAVVLHSERRTDFPSSVPIVADQAAPSSRTSVPVSVSLRAVGATKSARLTARGGQAQSSRSAADTTGFVAPRRSSTQGNSPHG